LLNVQPAYLLRFQRCPRSPRTLPFNPGTSPLFIHL
jgi:hypothetical protein